MKISSWMSHCVVSGALHQWFWRHEGTLQLALRQLAAVPADLRDLESMLPEGNQLEDLSNPTNLPLHGAIC